MVSRVRSWLSWPGMLRTLVSHVRLATRLVREPRVPLGAKALPVVAALYFLSPLDVIPDALPVIGQLDDLTAILLLLEAFVHICPTDAVTFHREAITTRRRYSPMRPAGDYIDA